MHHKNLLFLAAMSAVFAVSPALAAAVSIGEASLTGDQLTVPVTVDEVSEVSLLIGAAGPRDGNPADLMEVKSTATINGNGAMTVTIPVGAKIAYAAKVAGSTSETKEITATDTSEYIWVNNAKGLWSDPANWTRKNTASDGYANIGYPAYSTGVIRFNGGQTAEVTLDADYGKFGDLKIDNPNLDLTIHGAGHTLKVNNTACASDNTFLFDNVRFIDGGAYTLGSQSSMRLVNGTYFQTEWEFNVNGTNAKLYVGPECEIYASSGWWWTFRLDGNGAEVILDDGYIHSRGFRIGSQRGDATPAGIIFKGEHPRFEFDEEFVVCQKIPGNVAFEYFVPVGGYAQAPFRKTRSGNYIALDNKWTDHTSSSSVYTPVIFKINKYSPFYQSEDVSDICLFDWSATDQGVKTSQVLLGETDSPTSDYLVKRATQTGVDMDQIWAHMTGTGTPADLPSLGNPVASAETATGKVSLGAEVANVSGSYTTTLEVWADETGPADEVVLEKIAEVPVTGEGTAAHVFDGMLGSKVSYKLVLVASNGTKSWMCGSTEVRDVILKDDHSHRYDWKNGRSGRWSDSDNWTLNKGDDTRNFLGYPGWGANVGFYSTTSTITVDADFPEINEVILGWGGANLAFVSAAKNEETGSVEKVYTIEAGGFRDGQYDNIQVTLDGVCFDTLGSTYPAAYSVKNTSSLRMYNGATVRTRWAVSVEGNGAYLYVGPGCAVYVSKAEPYHRLGLAGPNAEIVIDDGLIDALHLKIAGSDAPKGITFKGKNPRLLLDDHMGNEYRSGVFSAINGSPVFTFEIPEEGYASTPILRTGNNGNTFAQTGEGIPPIVFKVSEESPYLNVKCHFTQQLMDWSNSAAEVKIAQDGVSLAKMPGSDKASIYFTPETDDQKSGIAAYCYGKDGFCVIVR